MSQFYSPRVSGTELGYAEITAAATSTTTGDGADVAGLSVTVTVGNRPIIVEFGCDGLYNTIANKNAVVKVFEGATQITQCQIGTASAANEISPASCRRRLAPTAGAHTYNVKLAAGSSSTATINAGATLPAWIQVTEV